MHIVVVVLPQAHFRVTNVPEPTPVSSKCKTAPRLEINTSRFGVRTTVLWHENNDEETRGKLKPDAVHYYTMMHCDSILFGSKK